MMLVICAFMLLGVVRNNFNNTVDQDYRTVDRNVQKQQAVTILRSIMDEIQTRKYDVVCTQKKVVKLTDLSTLGPAFGEYYPNFNDVDDFNGSVFRSPIGTGYTGTVNLATTPRSLWNTEGYTVRCTVDYVDPENPTVVKTSKTWAKRVTVAVSSRYFPGDTLKQSYIATF
jgi:hypothetical protein